MSGTSTAEANQLARTFSKILLALAGIGLVVCLYGLSVSALHDYPLFTQGQRAEGVVISIQDNGPYEKYPIIQFSVAGGTLSKFTSTEEDSSVTRGQKLPVLYVKDNPSNAVVDRGFFTWLITIFWLFGTIGCATGVARLLSTKH